MKEYGETAYQVGLLAPLGAVGRLSERSGARAEVGQRQDEEKRKTQLEQMQTEADTLNAAEAAKVEAEANKQTSDYAVQFADDHEALQKQYFDLRAQVKKPGPNATAAEQEAYKQSDAQLKALRKQLGQQAAEYLRIKPLAEQERARRAPKAEEAAPETPVPPPGQMEIPGFERGDFTEPEAAPSPETVDYNQQARVLRARLEELQTQARDTKNLDEKIALGERYSQTEKAALEAEKKAKEAIKPTQQIGMLKRKMAIAEEEGDVAAQVDLAQKLKALGVDDITAEAQTEMALTPFKGQSEGTDAFNKKIVSIATDAARVRTGTVEEEEQAGLEAQRAEQARLDAASAQEKAGIPAPPNFEMVGRPGQQARYDLFGEEEQQPLASAPLGQMKQMLTGEDVTYTAEEEKPRGSLRRAGPAPFNLYPSREGEAEPITRQGIEQRVDRLLLRDDLSPEARELFGRVSRAMPANDKQGALTALDQQLTKIENGEEGIYAEGAGKPVTYEGFPVKGARAEIAAPTEANKTDIETRASAAPGEMRTLAQERRKKYDEGIANGLTHAEASRRAYAGAAVQPEKVERTGVVAGEARKQKLVSEEMQTPAAFAAAKREREAQAAQDRAQGKTPTLQPLKTLRGPSIQPKPLSLRAEIEPFIALSERVAQDTSGQMGLFPESEKESIGAIKPTREAFERFMRSPYVNKLRKDIRDAKEKIKAAKSIDALQAQIKALTTRLADIKTAKEGYQSAKELLAANKDIQMASRDIAELHAAATKNIISRMEIDGRIDSLEKQRGELLQEGRAMGESVDPAFLADLNDAISELEDVRNERAILDGALNVLDVQIKLARAQTQIGDLLSQVPLASQVDELETNLATARQALVTAEAARREIQEKRDAAITEASKAAAVEKQKATSFAQKLSDEKTRIWNTIFSDVGTATRYRALTENEMAKRGYVAPADAKAADDYGKSLANKSVQILQLERGKIQKELDNAIKAVVAAKERSGKYVGGAQNVVTFRGLGRAIRLQAAAAVRLAAIEDALIARAAEEAPRSVTRGTPAVVKTATAQEQAVLDDQVERVNAVGRETERLESLKTEFASAKAKDKPEIGKKIQAQLLEVAKAEKAANEINARVSRASRVVAGAPSKLRTGSPESKAASGNTSQRVLEGRPVSQPTVEQAVEEANKAAADRLASLQTLTAKERKAALEKLTVAQENDLLVAANRKWEDAGTQLNNVRDRLAGLRQINIDFKEGKRNTPANAETINTLKATEAQLERNYNYARAEAAKFAQNRTEVETEKGRKSPVKGMQPEDLELFSRGKPAKALTTAQVKAELARALGGLPANVNVLSVYDTVADFEADYPQAAGRVPSDVKGLVQNGRAVLFAENIGKGETLGILLHEVGVHIGFRNFFNKAQYNALVTTVKNWAKRNDNSLEYKIATAAMERVAAAETKTDQIDDEILAYAVEEAVKAGVSPTGVYGGTAVRNWLRMIVDAFKKALTAFGLNPDSLTTGDLVNFAYGAAQLELKGTWHGTAGTFTEFDHAYMSSGEGSQAYGWGTYRAQRESIADYYRRASTSKLGGRTVAVVDAWYALPEIKKWNAESTNIPVYKGMTFDDAVAVWKKDKKANADIGAALSMLENRFFEPYYKTEEEFHRVIDAALIEERRWSHSNATRNKGTALGTKQAAAAKALDQMDAASFDYRSDLPPTLLPEPPKGRVLRTLHGQPEESFLDLDAPVLDQSARVGNALEKVFYALSNSQKAHFNRLLAGDNNPSGKDIYDAFKLALGTQKAASTLMASHGIAGNKFLDRLSRDKPITENTRYNYVDFLDKNQGSAIIASDLDPIGQAEGTLFSRTGKQVAYANPGLARAGEIGDTFIAKDRSTLDRVRAASGGFLGMETMLVDRFAGFERLSKTMEALKGSQMMYYLRMYDQRMNFVSQAVSNGALQIVEKTRSDGRKEFLVESKSGPSIAGVVNILKDSPAGSADAANRLFTLYLAANRAKNKGIETLHFGTALTQADLNEAMTAIRATPGLEENFKLAQKEYNDYNRGLIGFLVQTGAVGKDVANRLMAENDYIPFYRERGGLAELVIGNEPPIRIGSIAEQPYLKELVGGDKPILDFMTSSVQNTNLLADMGLRNLATKNAVFELVNMDLAKIGAGRGTAGPNVVRFKVDGEDRFALIDTDKAGIPADILVKGMEGIPTQLPAAFRLLGMPATLLRKAVTLSPFYAAKQLFRDSLAAPLLAGADFVPVLGALKEVGASSTKKLLEQRGITGGQIFTGTQADLTKILKDLAENKTVSWGSLIAKAEAINMEADAATRRAQYNSYIRQGLSEMEATLMSLESMNFNKRGASPSIHALNSLIPFFNAQIQSLNVLYKAITGKLPFNERLKIQEKLLTRGLMIAAGTLAYAAAMQDDEAYKNATPEQKYGNWFIRIPGVDEPIRLPIPFEVGYIFKALPEALYNTMVDKHGGEEAVKAFRTILLSTIPGGSSYGIPQALKPAIEAGLGKSFYTGRDILSRREQTLLPEQQFRENTSELAKAFGSLGISPIKVDALINGYTGTMGLAFAQAVGTLMPTRTAPEQAYKRLSEMPVVGGAFQPNDAGGIINNVYDHMLEFKKVKVTVDDMIKRGDTAGARELISTRSNEFAASQMADQFVTTMGKLTQYEQAIRASNNTPEQKREQLDKIRQAKIRFSEMTRQATDRTTPQ
jgi:hypothetical protein